MRRNWLLPIAMVIGAGSVALALTELGLRLTGLASPPGVLSVNHDEAERIPGVFVPRSTVTERKDPRFPHRITINSLGYRGPEVARDKAPGTTRILFVGDSFTWGDLVDDHETVPYRLEEGLRLFCPDVEVINAGVGGTTIDGQREMVRRGLELEPDLVILMFYDNDLSDLEPPTFWDLMMENRSRRSEFPGSILSATLSRTALWTVLRRARARFGTRVGSDSIEESDSPSPQEDRLVALKGSYKRYLEALTEELERHGTPLVVVGFPAHLTLLNPDATTNHLPWLSDLTDQLDLPFVSILTPLMDASAPIDELYFLPWDGHPRPLAYDIAAQELTRELRLEPQLLGCPTPVN